MQEKDSQSAIIILNNLKIALNIVSDKDLSHVFGVKPNTISTWKIRNSIDYSILFAVCERYNLDLNAIILSKNSQFEINSGECIALDEKNGNENGNVYGKVSNKNAQVFDKIEDKTESHAVLRKELYQDEQNIELLALQAEMGIPLIPDYAFAGFAPGSDTQILELNCEKYVIPHFKGADGLIHVKGSSMYPKYNSGDIVAFKKLSMGTFFQWNKVYIIDTEQGLLIKRVQQADDKEHILLVSENPSYKPFTLPLTDIYSLAIVVGVIRLE